jgi:hypothetical protein
MKPVLAASLAKCADPDLLAAVESHIPNNRGKITLKNFGSPKAFITCEEMYTLQNLHVVKKIKITEKVMWNSLGAVLNLTFRGCSRAVRIVLMLIYDGIWGRM